MALRTTSRQLKTLVMNRLGTTREMATSTVPKLKPFQLVGGPHHADHRQDFRSRVLKADFVPVYVALGMILVSTSLGLLTAKQTLQYNPSVRLNKKRREKLVEVEEPERVVEEADRLIKKSFFRKVAHVQAHGDRERPVIYDPSRADPFDIKEKAVTLKSVGVDPSKH